jgi:hypothetical protein
MNIEEVRLRARCVARLRDGQRLHSTARLLRARVPYALPAGATLLPGQVHLCDGRRVLRVGVDLHVLARELGVVEDPAAAGLARVRDLVRGRRELDAAFVACRRGVVPSAVRIGRAWWIARDDVEALRACGSAG